MTKHVSSVDIAVAALFDSPGFKAASTRASPFCGGDQPSLVESFRKEFGHLYGLDQASEQLWTAAAGRGVEMGRPSDLSVVSEERSDEELHGALARSVEEYNSRDTHELRRAYSCDHCHCSVCKRSLAHHDCQRSVSSSSDHGVMSDDAGGIVAHRLIYICSLLCPL